MAKNSNSTAKKSAAKAKRPNVRRPTREQLEQDRLKSLTRILSFGSFLSASFSPQISDVEIVACFCDLRGFTEYCTKLQRGMQDRKIQNFLRDYVRIFNEGLMAWATTWTDTDSRDYQASVAEFATHLVPSSYKNLGDEMLLVWEIPPNLDIDTQGSISMQTLYLISEIQQRFEYRFRNLTPAQRDAYSDDVLKMEMGFGVAKGHAWKLDFGTHTDYAGSVLNLAARLQDFARPSGMVVHTDVATWVCDERSKDGHAKLVEISGIKGFDTPVRACVDNTVDTSGESFRLISVENEAKGSE